MWTKPDIASRGEKINFMARLSSNLRLKVRVLIRIEFLIAEDLRILQRDDSALKNYEHLNIHPIDLPLLLDS
jgi:hypothetical protein